MAKKFGLSTDHWLTMLERERNITPDQYRREIIWPTLALQRLAAAQIAVSQDELRKAFETEYGPKVKVRLIAVSSRQKADDLRQKAAANPETFGDLAKESSEDANSASARGLIPPIRKNLGQEEVEKVAFGLKEGEISPVLQVGEPVPDPEVRKTVAGDLPLQPAPATDRSQLHDQIRDQKLRTAATDLFQKLQAESKVVNVYNDAKLREQMPGVVATVNGQSVSLQQLTDECYQRHAKDVVEGEINRLVLQQELRKRGKTVTDADIDEEIRRAADAYGYLKPDGTPDVDAWLKAVTETDKVSVDLYVRDAVWPSVALKLLVNEKIEVTKEDLERGSPPTTANASKSWLSSWATSAKPIPSGRWPQQSDGSVLRRTGHPVLDRARVARQFRQSSPHSPLRRAALGRRGSISPAAGGTLGHHCRRRQVHCAEVPGPHATRSCRISPPWKGSCGRTSKRRSSGWPWLRSSIDSRRQPRSTTSSPGLPRAARKPRLPRIRSGPTTESSRQPTVRRLCAHGRECSKHAPVRAQASGF